MSMWGIACQEKHGQSRSNFRAKHQKNQENKTCGQRLKEVGLFNMEK